MSGSQDGRQQQEPRWKENFKLFQHNANKFINAYMKRSNSSRSKDDMNKIYSIEGLIKNINVELAQAVAAKNFITGCDFSGMECKINMKFSKQNGWCSSIQLPNSEAMQDQVLTITAFAGETAGIDIGNIASGQPQDVQDQGFKVFLQQSNDYDEYEMVNRMRNNIGDFTSGRYFLGWG